MFDMVLAELDKLSCKYVYIDTPVDTCATRIAARARPGEIVPLTLLQKIDAKLKKHYRE